MIMAVIVLNNLDCLEKLLQELTTHGFSGATILESTGMAHALNNEDDLGFISAFRALLNPEREKSKTIFTVIEDSKFEELANIVNDVTGGLDKPDSGIIFSLPVSKWEGFKH